MKKDGINLSDNENAIKIIKKHKIPMLLGSFIIGSPMEDKKDILTTLKFIKKSKLDDFGLYVLTPFPGTPIWEYAKSRGFTAAARMIERHLITEKFGFFALGRHKRCGDRSSVQTLIDDVVGMIHEELFKNCSNTKRTT